MTFRTSYDRERIYSEPGSPWQDLYKFKINKETGKKELVKTEAHDNLYDYIQSHADSCDIHVLMQRFANGDTTVLNHGSGLYGDFTNLPSNLAEVHERLMEVHELFKDLPNEVREKFDFSYDVFAHSFGTQEWFDAIALMNPKDDINSKLETTTIEKGENLDA